MIGPKAEPKGIDRMTLLDAGLGASRGDAVLALLQRAQVPPVPPFYKLCYDYLAGVKSLDTMRAGAMLEAPPDQAGATREQLYRDFVAPYEQNQPLTRIAATMIVRIKALETLIVQSQTASRNQASDLADASLDLQADEIDAGLIVEWVGRLQATQAALQAANAALSSELEQSGEVFKSARNELQALSQSIQLDPVTGIANRAGVNMALAAALEHLAHNGGQLALALIDVDNFKALNDSYGHQVGDEILRVVGRALLAATRDGDIIGRMGGDEFILVIRDEDLAGAKLIAERVRRSVVDCDLSRVLGKGVVGGVTASIGIALYGKGDSLPSVYERADQNLFEAKRSGRNQVVAKASPRAG